MRQLTIAGAWRLLAAAFEMRTTGELAGKHAAAIGAAKLAEYGFCNALEKLSEEGLIDQDQWEEMEAVIGDLPRGRALTDSWDGWPTRIGYEGDRNAAFRATLALLLAESNYR